MGLSSDATKLRKLYENMAQPSAMTMNESNDLGHILLLLVWSCMIWCIYSMLYTVEFYTQTPNLTTECFILEATKLILNTCTNAPLTDKRYYYGNQCSVESNVGTPKGDFIVQKLVTCSCKITVLLYIALALLDIQAWPKAFRMRQICWDK